MQQTSSWLRATTGHKVVVLIRHCSTAANEGGELLADNDLGLSPLGLRQVEPLDHWLDGTVEGGVCSPAKRAQQTAKALGWSSVATYDALAERSLGSWEGLTAEESRRRRAKMGLAKDDYSQMWAGIDEVEQDISVFHRSWQVILAQLSTRNVVVVLTHAGVIKSIVSQVLGISPQRSRPLRITTGGAAVLAQREDVWELQELWPNPLAGLSRDRKSLGDLCAE